MHNRLDKPVELAQARAERPDQDMDEEREPVPQLPGSAAQLIGMRMRAMYDSIAHEPVPDELLELVRRLEAKEKSK